MFTHLEVKMKLRRALDEASQYAKYAIRQGSRAPRSQAKMKLRRSLDETTQCKKKVTTIDTVTMHLIRSSSFLEINIQPQHVH